MKVIGHIRSRLERNFFDLRQAELKNRKPYLLGVCRVMNGPNMI